jgi:CDP-diacylglycerol--glycerol-3-phosphate 3-phosphatidyltransferase
LNKSYFTNRQDRYVHFKSQKLADYCASFIETASGFSYRLAAPSTSPSYELVWPGSTHPHQFHANANDRLKALQDQYRHQTPNVTDGEVLMFPIMQLGQFDVREESSFFAMLFDQLSKASGQPVVDLTSGYFGLAPEYRKLVVDSKVDVKLLCASPKVCPVLYILDTRD